MCWRGRRLPETLSAARRGEERAGARSRAAGTADMQRQVHDRRGSIFFLGQRTKRTLTESREGPMLAIEEIAAIPLFSVLSTAELERLARTVADIQLSAVEFAVHEGGECPRFAVFAV